MSGTTFHYLYSVQQEAQLHLKLATTWQIWRKLNSSAIERALWHAVQQEMHMRIRASRLDIYLA